MAGTLFVDAGASSGAADGSSWGNAFQGSDGLRAALAVALPGDQVWVAGGTYLPTQTGSRTDAFRMANGVEVYGGFVGTESSLSERVLGVSLSILSGDLAGDDNSGGSPAENSYHVIRGAAADATAIFDGFTVSGGNANTGGGNKDRGGGIIFGNGSAGIIRHCRLTGNRCNFGGGAVYINNSAPTFTDTVFEGNTGGSFGGAIDIATSGAVLFDRCQFFGNSASRAGALEIFATSGVVASNCLFSGNTATGGGGGGAIWMGSGGNTQLRNCTVVGNNSQNQASAGLRVQGGAPSVANCIFWNNTGPGGAQNSVNQISGTTNVTYSLVQGGFAGQGNLGADPQFSNAAAGDYSLGAGSPAIDAGDNTQVPAGVVLDLAREARFVDDPSVADTGVGPGPQTDIGALEVQAGFPVTAFCFGDGSGTPCPCANNGAAGRGCGNGAFQGGSQLASSGIGSLSADSLTLIATDSSPHRPGIFFQGALRQNGGAGSVLGDGLRCAGGAIVHLQVIFADSTGTAVSTLAIASAGGVTAGDTRRYQWWYRDGAWGSCGGGFNLSNGIEFTWLP